MTVELREVADPGRAVPRVELRSISKRFGATQALSDVSLAVAPSEVHALVGENGAGKSTLVKILAGVHLPDTGETLLDGVAVQLRSPAQARSLGIAVVHQEPRLFPDLTVAENVFMAHPPTARFGIDWAAMSDATAATFRELEVHIDPAALVRGLSMADQQLIEIAKALSTEARLLVLDEPTASLSLHETERLFAIVERLRSRGTSVLFVSHRLEEVFALCERASILRDGRHVLTAATAELSTAELIRHMVGRAVTLFPKSESKAGEILLEVDGLGRDDVFRDVSFVVRSGEILGFAGLVGAGRTEVARVLFGVDRADAGSVRLDGTTVAFKNPGTALEAGIAYLPEDRHQNGLVLDFPIDANMSLPILDRLFPRLILRRPVERRLAEEQARRLSIRMQSVGQLAAALSGGNQQKVVLAKWLAAQPRLLILDEPTRGIDIGAKVEVHRIISELAASGLAVMLISSDLPEVLAMSDRLVVMHEGTITAELGRGASEEEVMFAATGQARLEVVRG